MRILKLATNLRCKNSLETMSSDAFNWEFVNQVNLNLNIWVAFDQQCAKATKILFGFPIQSTAAD